MVYVSLPRTAPHRMHRQQVQCQPTAATTATGKRAPLSTRPGERCLWYSRCRFQGKCRGLHSRPELALFEKHSVEAYATDCQTRTAIACQRVQADLHSAVHKTAPTSTAGSHLGGILDVPARRRRHRRPRKRQRVRHTEWRTRMQRERKERRRALESAKQQRRLSEDAQADANQIRKQMYSADQRYLAAQVIATEALADV